MLKEILTLDAFEPKATESCYTLRERCKNESFVVLNLGNRCFRTAKAQFDGKNIKIEDEKNFAPVFSDAFFEHLETLAPSKRVAISLNYGIEAEFSEEIPSFPEKRLQYYTLEQGVFLLGSISEDSILKVEKEFFEREFTILRIQLTALNGLFSLEKTHKGKCCVLIDQGYLIGINRAENRILNLNGYFLDAENPKNSEKEAIEDFFRELGGTEFILAETPTPAGALEKIRQEIPCLQELNLEIENSNEWEVLCDA